MSLRQFPLALIIISFSIFSSSSPLTIMSMATSQPSSNGNGSNQSQQRGYQSSYLPRPPPPNNADDGAEMMISFEDIGRYPGRACLGRTGAPTKICFGPDDESVVFLGASGGGGRGNGGGGLTQKLWKRSIIGNDDTISELAKPPDGVGEEDTLSPEEKLRRERTRQLETGITSFAYASGGGSVDQQQQQQTLLCPVGNDLFVKKGNDDGDLIKVVDAAAAGLPGAVIDPHLSGDGSLVVFCCEKEIYACSTTGNSNNNDDDNNNSSGNDATPKRLTYDARGTSLTNGLADFIAMEEMSRYGGFWISPNADYVAFEQSDESHIAKFRIMKSGQPDPLAQEDHHYPFAGEANPVVKLGLVHIQSTKVTWLDISSVFGEDMYLARVQWGPSPPSTTDQQELYVQIMNRQQTELVLLRFNIPHESKEDNDCNEPLVGTELLREVSSTWINLHEMFVPLKKSGGGGFLWASERTGYSHLYRYRADGSLVGAITSGEDWMVEHTSESMVDEDAGVVYFTGTRDGPKESHLYSASLTVNDSDGGATTPEPPRRVTPAGGTHAPLSVNHKKTAFIDSWSSTKHPFRVAVRSLKDGSILKDLYDGAKTNDGEKIKALKLSPPEWFTIAADDECQTPLHGAIYKPDASVHGPGPYPAIVSVYGGPHAQTVADSWTLTADLRAQRLRSQGYAVIKLDNRGSSRRGLAFEGAIRHDMGNLEVSDQVAAVKHWIDEGVVKADAVGIYGWSYGGYMSGMCLAKRPDVFKAAVAGAMVSSWDGYDTCYTERYMGTPQSNPDGYARSAVMPYVNQIEGSLLIIHGLVDENVHFRHSARLINALIQAQKHYELLLFPDERHVPRGLKDKIFMEQRIASFFERCL